MNERAQILAQRMEQANNQLIATIEQCSENDWRKPCGNDNRPVGTVVRHIMEAHAFVLDAAQAVAAGGSLSATTWEMVCADNTKQAGDHAQCDRAETIELLRRNCAEASRAIRGMNDEQLARKSTWELDGEVTVQQVIERHMIDHVQGHLANIETAVRAW